MNHRTFSSRHRLTVSSLGAAVAIVHVDREGHPRGRSQRRQRRASSRLVRRLLRREIAPWLLRREIAPFLLNPLPGVWPGTL